MRPGVANLVAAGVEEAEIISRGVYNKWVCLEYERSGLDLDVTSGRVVASEEDAGLLTECGEGDLHLHGEYVRDMVRLQYLGAGSAALQP